MLRVLFLCIFVLINFSTSFSGTDYSIEISNIEKVNSSSLEFDVYIKSQTTQFELTSYQCVFSFNKDISNSSSFSFSYINDTSQLTNIPPEAGIGVNNSDGELKLTFASLPGSEFISTKYIKIGRFRLTTDGTFNNQPPEIKWCFSGKINTILTGANFEEITDSSYHLEQNYGQLSIVNVIASETTDTLTSPEKTIDGKGANDGEPFSRWAARPMPEYLIFDLGSIKNISQTKFSFYNWNNNRIYKYSILTSSDLSNWYQIANDDSSSSSEWTANIINKAARYVKLVFLSNNQCDWAGLWEAQIYGNSDTLDTSIKKPLVNIPFKIEDETGHLDSLFVGIDSTACDGLDSCLGEVEFQQPPSGTFSAWLNVPNSQMLTLRDYRYGSMINNYVYTYQVQCQRGNASKIIVRWNLPSTTKLRIQDIITGNIIDTVFYPGADSLIINDPSDLYKLNLTVTYLSKVLPVELTSFKAEVIDKTVELKWKTATELNIKGFEVERKIFSNSKWETIGFIKGNGTSTNPMLYKYTDDFKEQIINGAVTYRLKQISLDGNAEYSDEIKVKVDLTPKDFVLYQNYPNPFNPTTNIKYALPYESNVDIAIYNVLGERVKILEKGIKEAGNHNIVWQAKNQSSGIYFCTITARSTDGKNNFRKTRKMLLIK
ncbi:MAG: discoidin domain-containing protein [Ignavibacteriaceae bacterium]